MKHEPPPRMPDEPPFMAEFRAIDAHITKQVNRYIAWARSLLGWVLGAAFAGQFLGWGVTTLLKWWIGLS